MPAQEENWLKYDSRVQLLKLEHTLLMANTRYSYEQVQARLQQKRILWFWLKESTCKGLFWNLIPCYWAVNMRLTIRRAEWKNLWSKFFFFYHWVTKLSKPPLNNHLFELFLHVCFSQLPAMKRKLELFFVVNSINKTHNNRLVVKSF